MPKLTDQEDENVRILTYNPNRKGGNQNQEFIQESLRQNIEKAKSIGIGGGGSTSTDFANAAEREEFDRNMAQVSALRAQRSEEGEQAPAAPSDGSQSEDSKFIGGAFPNGEAIASSGQRKLGIEGKFQDLSQEDQLEVFRAGLQTEGISEDSEQISELKKAGWWDAITAPGGPSGPFGRLTNGAGRAIARDVGKAVVNPVNTAAQIPSGVLEAYNEIVQFGGSLDVLASDTFGYWPALQVFDENGDFSLAITDAGGEQMREHLTGGDSLLNVDNPFPESKTVTGNLVKGVSQFAVPFSVANKAIKVTKALKFLSQPGAWRSLSRYALAGFVTDFAAFDPEMERLTDMADQAGFPVIEYLKSEEDDSEWESRFKNAVEGGVIGGAADLVFMAFRGLKGARRTKDALETRMVEMDRVEAEAADAINRDIWSQGDPNGAAVEIVQPPRAETVTETAARRQATPENPPAIQGERFLEDDFFDIEARKDAPTDGSKFAIGESVPDRQRFVQEEIVARSYEAGDIQGFSTRGGDVGVEFVRFKESAVINWDWLDNIANKQSFRPRDVSLPDMNEIFSKLGAVVEVDARATNTPSYTFSGGSIGLDRAYERLGPKLADRMGYEFRMTDSGFALVHPDAVSAYKALDEIRPNEALNPEDFAARREMRSKVLSDLPGETGLQRNLGTGSREAAAQSLQRDLESKGSKFAFGDDGDGFTAANAAERVEQLRDAGRKAFGDSYNALEADGRVSYAREPGDIDPDLQKFSSGAQAVTKADGGVIIFTRNTTPEMMEGVLLHEVGIHSGMENMVGAKGFDDLLKRVEDLIAAGDGPATRAKQRVPEATAAGDVSHETLAYMVQHAPNQPLVKELVSNVKAWVVREFPGSIKRLGLKEGDFRQLAVMALRREAIISGQVVAVFGRVREVVELGSETPRPKPLFNTTSPLLLDDRLSISNAQPVRQAFDLDAKPDDLVAQVVDMQDDLLGPGFTERLFAADETFDPFLWRDTVEAIGRGDARPSVLDQFKRTMETVKEPDAVAEAVALPKEVTESLFPRADDGPFTTSAEQALSNPTQRWKDAKSLTAEQWRNYFRDAGAGKEAFEFQIDPALKTLDPKAKISREDMTAAIEANRPNVQAVARGKDKITDLVLGDTPTSAEVYYKSFDDWWAVKALPKSLKERVRNWAKGNLDRLKLERSARQETDYSDYVSPGKHTNYQQELIILPDAAKGFRSHNWKTEGVVGHIRTTDRVTVGGEKVRFVDELQSDLHQEGSKHGYDGDPAGSIAKRERAERRWNDWQDSQPEGANISPLTSNISDEGRELYREYVAAREVNDSAPRSIPQAPIKDWEKPFIRRVIQQAIADGKEVVAFTNYDTLHSALKNKGTKKFYDTRMPAHIRKVAKELRAKVETHEILIGEDILQKQVPGKVLALRITPEARSKLRRGNPMFAMGEAPGRLDDRLNATVLDDIKTGRRGLETDEAEALLGAAERWAAAVRRQQPSRAQTLEDLLEQIKTRNDPEDMRYLVELMDGAKAVVAEPPSLMTFLRKAGGIKDEGGELAARDLGRVKFTNNKTGLTMDEALERAWEAGYVGKPIEGDRLGIGARPADETRPVFDDLLDAIDREMMGEKVYSIQDFDWVQEAAARQDMRAELSRLGIDPNSPKAQIISEFDRIAKWQEGEPLTLKDMRDLDRIEQQAKAKPGIGLPNRGLLGGNEVRINFNAINSGDDIRSVMGQLADAFSGEIDTARGGVRTNKQIIQDSRRLSAFEALNNRRGNTPLADAEVPAAQALYIASTENVKRALELAVKTGTDTAHYNARRALTMHRAVQAEIAGAKADASRALRAWGVAQTATAQARRELNNVMEAYGGKLDPEESARLSTLLEKNPEGFDKAVRTTIVRKVADVGGEILRFAWLSGPQTHVMNMAGNTLTMVYDIGTRLGAGLKGKITGDAALEHQLSIAMKEYAGLMAGIRAQFRAFGKKADYAQMGRRLQEAKKAIAGGNIKQGLKTGVSALALDNPVSATFRGRFDDRGVSGQRKLSGGGSERAISAENFGAQQGSAAAKVINGMGALFSAPVEFLGFADDFFKGVNELATRYRMAQEMVLKEAELGLSRDDMQARFAEIVDNPPVEVLEEARRVAQRRTFTEPVGEGTRTILKGRNFLNKLGFPLGHLFLPFVTTPSNILKFAFQNGPTGILFKEVRDELAAGGVRAANAQARIAAGTGLLMVGMDMVANGTMTGRAPQDPGERELWDRAGIQEYSAKVGGMWFSYRRLEPVSTMMAIGSDLQTIFMNRALDDTPDEDLAELIGPVLGSAINVVTSKTFLTSMTEFIKFTEDGERYGPQFVEKLGASIAAPAILAQTEKVQDPVIREASSMMEKWMARMPGFSENLPPSRDLWGRTRHVSSGLGHWYDALSPFTVRTQDAEPIDAELQRIGFYPTRPGKSITVQSPFGVNVAINLRNRPDIWTRYVEMSGNELKLFDGLGTKDYLNAVISGNHPDSAEYNLLPDSSAEPISKETFIQRRIDQARRVARLQLQQEFQSDLQAMAAASLQAQRQSNEIRQALPVE